VGEAGGDRQASERAGGGRWARLAAALGGGPAVGF